MPGQSGNQDIHFNPRFPRGKRLFRTNQHNTNHNFNPRFPRGKRPTPRWFIVGSVYFNPRFPRGKRRTPIQKPAAPRAISIHASRGGSDYLLALPPGLPLISIHASRGGSDCPLTPCFSTGTLFQSTLPAGEATAMRNLSDGLLRFQSTLPAGEATVRSSCPLMTARSSMGSANRDFPVFLSAVSMLFFFWALGVRVYRIMVSLGSYPFFVPI